VFFEGTAREAAARFPQNANVALITALAGLGPEATRIALVADPEARANRHEIEAEGAFGRMALAFENAPLPENPKSSAMTALSLVRLIENRAAAVVI
jgi:aspartate dehydrogenase